LIEFLVDFFLHIHNVSLLIKVCAFQKLALKKVLIQLILERWKENMKMISEELFWNI